MPGPRDYTKETLTKLNRLSLNKCYNPECNAPLVSLDNTTNLGNVAHICAASVQGPRFDPNMSDDERRHFDNLILLCSDCHKIVDNPSNEKQYPVSLLKEWKNKREVESRLNNAASNPSVLLNAIQAISNMQIDDNNEAQNNLIPYKIEEKIRYNDLKDNKDIIREYSSLFGKIETIYDELDRNSSNGKIKLLRIIRNAYLHIKGQYTNGNDDISIIRDNADKIYNDIERYIEAQVSDKINIDDISAVPIIMADAFIRCKILEEPPSKI